VAERNLSAEKANNNGQAASLQAARGASGRKGKVTRRGLQHPPAVEADRPGGVAAAQTGDR